MPQVLHLAAYSDRDGKLWWVKSDPGATEMMLSPCVPTGELFDDDPGLPISTVELELGPLKLWLVTMEGGADV